MKPPTEAERKRIEDMETELQRNLQMMIDVVGHEVSVDKIKRYLHGANGNVERALNHLYSELSLLAEPQSPNQNPNPVDSLHQLLLTVAEEVKCPLCLTYFTQPVILPTCNHAFCASCLESVVKDNSVVCPLCRKTCQLPESGLKALQHNTTLSNIVDTLRKAQSGRSICEKCTKNPCIFFCYECQTSLCDGCSNMIHSVSSCSQHRRVPIDEYFIPKPDADHQLEWMISADVSPAESLECFNSWVKSLWFLPPDFRSQLQLENFRQIYVPYWCFNIDSESKYSGTVSYTHGSQMSRDFDMSPDRHSHSSQQRWPSEGIHQKFHAKLYTPATSIPDPEVLQNLEPWDMSVIEKMVKIPGNFELKGSNISSDRGLAKIKEEIDKLVTDECHSKLGNGRGIVSNLKVETNFNLKTVMRVYVPVLHATYRYQHRTFHFAINGKSRKCFGQRPFVFSTLKQRALGTVGAALGLLRPY